MPITRAISRRLASRCLRATAFGQSSAAAWLPTSASGLRLWLRAGTGYSQDSAGSTPATADADPVGRWADQSGNGYHVSQATDAKRGTLKTNQINGNSVVRFDGTADCLLGTTLSNLIANNAYAVYILAKASAAATNNVNTYSNTMIVGGNDQLHGLHLKSAPAIHAYNWDGSDDNVSAAIVLGTAFVAHFRHDTGNLVLSKDGGAETSAASGNTTGLTGVFIIGARDASNLFFNGDICEVLVYNVVLGASDHTAAVAYMKTLGGIA